MTETVGFIGLGSMGLPMARRLLDAGYALRVYNRTPARGGIAGSEAREVKTPPKRRSQVASWLPCSPTTRRWKR